MSAGLWGFRPRADRGVLARPGGERAVWKEEGEMQEVRLHHGKGVYWRGLGSQESALQPPFSPAELPPLTFPASTCQLERESSEVTLCPDPSPPLRDLYDSFLQLQFLYLMKTY